MSIRKGIIIFVLAVLVGTAYWAIRRNREPHPPEFTATAYRNAGFGFEFTYGNGFRLLERKEDMYAASYIPPCDPETVVACIYYPKETFGNTNFGGAGFGVRVIPNVTACPPAADQGAGLEFGSEHVNGVDFEVVKTGGAAMSKQNQDVLYRAYRDGRCYEIVTRINTATFEVYEPGTIERFTPQMEIEVLNSLGEVLASFRFTED